MQDTKTSFELGTAWRERALGLLRIVAALIFMAHGTQKLLGFPAGGNVPPMLSMPGLAGVIELVGGAMLLLGIWVRPAAFIMSGTMAVAYWMAHAPRSFFPVNNGGDAAILYCFVFLYIFVAGGGAFQLGKGTGSLQRVAR
ncbi:DoxX family protein [Pseudoroseomonas globiformis]|uniref:DoxX family protein n=1 Tax=Teichococcus globiformis TaxID=2307229 RepID=A0ABV7G8E0_9PROT